MFKLYFTVQYNIIQFTSPIISVYNPRDPRWDILYVDI